MNPEQMRILAEVDVREVAIKTTAGAGLSLATWSEIAAFATAMYFLFQIGLLIPKYLALYRAWRAGKELSDGNPE